MLLKPSVEKKFFIETQLWPIINGFTENIINKTSKMQIIE